MKRISDFEGRTSDPVSVEYISTLSGIIPVYSIKSFHSLTQFIGYGKYINKSLGNVYLRGQTSLYDGYMSPSVLRKKKVCGSNPTVKDKADTATANTVKHLPIKCERRISEYKRHIKESTKDTSHFSGWDKDVIEPLLQHSSCRRTKVDGAESTVGAAGTSSLIQMTNQHDWNNS